MELLQTPQHVKAWTCPECGHGSPEPRDQRAHLDAHRQLKQFFREWDAAGAAEQRAKHRGRRTLLLGSAGLLVAILLAVALLLQLSAGDGAVPPRAVPSTPSPRADLPSTTTPPAPRPQPPAVTPNRPEPSTDAATGRAASAPAPPTAPSTTGPPSIAPPPPASAAPTTTAAPAPVATIPPPPSPARETGLAVHGCVLVVCLAIGL